MRHPPLVLLAALAVLGACDRHSPTAAVTGPHLDFIRGNGISDTVAAQPIQSLLVGVRTGTDVSAGTVVRFQTVGYQWPNTGPVVFVSPLSSPGYGSFATATTNAQGTASVLIEMGPVTGTAKLAVTVPDLGISDTATFTVLPGAAAAVRVLPHDTAIYVTGKVAERAAVVDRFGNARPESGTLASGGGAISLSGGVATGVSDGRAFVVGTDGAWSDTGWVSVVPHGTLAAARDDSLCVFNMDGSNLHCLAPLGGNALGGYGLGWSPSGAEVMWAQGPYTQSRLYAVNMSGSVRRVIPSPPDSLIEEAFGGYATDGSVFFSGQTPGQNFGLWHVAAAGTNPATAAPLAPGDLMWRPSPSPDRTQLTFVGFNGSGAVVQTIALSSGQRSSWAVAGQTPRWSPDGAHIAFVAPYGGTISLIAPDGSGQHTVAAPRTYAEAGANWSPDSGWLVARGATSLELINVATGTALPLGYATRYSEAAWKPN